MLQRALKVELTLTLQTSVSDSLMIVFPQLPLGGDGVCVHHHYKYTVKGNPLTPSLQSNE